MNTSRFQGARMALNNASAALDRGQPMVAEQFAGSAARMLREANINEQQQRQLVAPHDRPKTGDSTVLALSVFVNEQQQRQLVAPHDRPKTGDNIVLALSVFVFIWLLADYLGSKL